MDMAGILSGLTPVTSAADKSTTFILTLKCPFIESDHHVMFEWNIQYFM